MGRYLHLRPLSRGIQPINRAAMSKQRRRIQASACRDPPLKACRTSSCDVVTKLADTTCINRHHSHFADVCRLNLFRFVEHVG